MLIKNRIYSITISFIVALVTTGITVKTPVTISSASHPDINQKMVTFMGRADNSNLVTDVDLATDTTIVTTTGNNSVFE
jgi:ethanolamine utilization protein EutP (predicted NTPase)